MEASEKKKTTSNGANQRIQMSAKQSVPKTQSVEPVNRGQMLDNHEPAPLTTNPYNGVSTQ